MLVVHILSPMSRKARGDSKNLPLMLTIPTQESEATSQETRQLTKEELWLTLAENSCLNNRLQQATAATCLQLLWIFGVLTIFHKSVYHMDSVP